jgi:N-acetylated-alpha-linked acidic dipeptidase
MTRLRLSMTMTLAALAVAWTSAQAPRRAPAREQTLGGFTAASSRAELARERELASKLSAKEAEADFDVMTAEPHHAGSPYELKLADYVEGRFKEYGFDVSRREYSVLLPWPGERSIEVVAPDTVKLHVEEEVLPDDPYASKPGILPAYNAYSPSGDVTGELVYVNYGIPADYEQLAKLGVDVKGKIVLARYGGSWRGIKPKVAAEHGAIACLIYSDPRDDGYFQGDTFPDGPWRGMGMIQRGSVMDMPRYPGDPSTPDKPSSAGADALPIDQIKTLSPIPVQPLSARDGQTLLERLKGQVVPEAWRGALPLTYHLGPGPARVHVKLQMDYARRRLVDVVGTVTGSEAPDEWVIVGSHRDAWVFGASDSVSGHVSMMSVARAMGQMMKAGWRPRRTLMFVSWDGEEPGLLGSTEFVEDLTSELRGKTAIYVNRDAGATGPFFSASAVHSLTPFVYELAKSIPSDQPGKTLYDRWLEHAREEKPAKDGQKPLAAPEVGALGSGSDFTAFLDHIGISSLDMGVGGTGDGGTYHSIYDDPAWFKKYIDPDFKWSVLAARVTGVALLRLSEAEVLPLDYQTYARQITTYIDEIRKEAEKKSAVKAKQIDFAGLRSAALAFAEAGAGARGRGATLLAASPTRDALAAINRQLMAVERELIAPGGLPDRPWFRHTIYAPGLYTGYGVKTIPGVREAVDSGNFTRAAEQAKIVIDALRRAARALSPS